MPVSLLISWNPITNSTLAGYKIKFGTTSGSYSQSVSVGKVTSYTLQNLTDGVRYYFVVAGVDGNSVEGMPSAEVSGLVLNSASIAASSITTSSAMVSWTTNKPGSSQVEYGTTTSYGTTTPLDSTLVANHSQTLTNLNPGTTYNYRIRSIDAGGSVHVSGNATFTTTAALSSSNVATSSITTSSAVITWTTNRSSNSQVEYGITTSYGSSTPLDSTLVVSHSQTLTNLNPGTTYNYRIRSTDASGSAHVSANFTLTTMAPLSSSGVAAGSITTSSAIVTWTTNRTSSSQVEYGTTTSYGSTTPLDSTLVVSHAQTLTNLNPGTTYHYRIRSTDAGGSSHVSGNFTFTTTAALSSGNVTASSTSTSSAVITWTTNRSSNSQVEYGVTTSYGSSTPLDSTLVVNHSQTLTNLNPGTTYNYRIRSADANGASHVSGNFTFTTTAALSSSNVAASSITTSSAVITWTTNRSSNSQVEYGRTSSYGFATAVDSTLVVSHSQTLTNLTPGTTYHYRIRSTDANGSAHVSANFTFTTAVPKIISVNIGGGAVAQFGADSGFTGGKVHDWGQIPIDLLGVTNPAPEAVYQTERWGPSFSYTLSNLTASAPYYVRLHFVENHWTSAGQRRFHVSINGVQVLTDFDILAAAGKQSKVSIQQFRAVANSGGQIVVQYSQGSVNYPSAYGIELLPANQVNSPMSEINVGGGAAGTFQADPAGSGGTTTTYSVTDAINTTGILNPAPQEVYQTERRGSDFTYTVSNLTLNASYLVRLHFAEIYWSSAGQRKFNVSINGVPVLKDFDIVATAGAADRAVIREFAAVPNVNRALAIRFTSGSVDLAKVNGIQVVPLTPVASVNSGGVAKGSFGNDSFYSGGAATTVTAVIDTSAVTPLVPASIYSSARTGNFSYTIPNLVPGAVYSLRLHFAETSSVTSQRQFNVSINGTSVLNNFDIVSVAGGLNKAAVLQYAVVADSAGRIVLQFSSTQAGGAKISAIEVLK